MGMDSQACFGYFIDEKVLREKFPTEFAALDKYVADNDICLSQYLYEAGFDDTYEGLDPIVRNLLDEIEKVLGLEVELIQYDSNLGGRYDDEMNDVNWMVTNAVEYTPPAQENKEHIKEQNKKYEEENKDKIKERRQKYKEENKDKRNSFITEKNYYNPFLKKEDIEENVIYEIMARKFSDNILQNPNWGILAGNCGVMALRHNIPSFSETTISSISELLKARIFFLAFVSGMRARSRRVSASELADLFAWS